MRRSLARIGFTLVVLLVVIAIIGVLIALLLPAIQAAREAARRTQCQNHLKQQGLAVQMHQDVYKRLPTGRTGFDQKSVSWAYALMPFLEEKPAHDAHQKTLRADDAANSQTMRTPVNVYACPSRRSAAADRNFDNNDAPPAVLAAASLGDYAGNAGHVWHTGMTGAGDFELAGYDPAKAGPIFTASRISTRHVTDGLSHTLAVGERHIPPAPNGTSPPMEHYAQGDTAFIAGDNPNTILAATATGLAADPTEPGLGKFGSLHSGITQFVFLDGHVDALSNSTPPASLMAKSTIGGSEPSTE